MPPARGADPARRVGPPGPHGAAGVVPRRGGRGRAGRAARDRRTRRGAAPGARRSRPGAGQRCRGTHHLGGPEHHGVRPDHARHGEGAGRARRGRLPGRHRWRRHERAPVVAPGCGRSHVGAAVEIPAVRVVSRCARSRPGGDPARLRADRVHGRASGPAGAAPLAHAGGARHRRPRADRPAAPRSSTPTTRASTRWPTPRGWAVLRRRAAGGRSPRRRSLGGAPVRVGARGHGGSRAGRGRQLGRAHRSRDHGGRHPDQRGRAVPLAARPPRAPPRTLPPRRWLCTAMSPGCGRRSS